ncbi:PIN domain-containing protein [Mesorhizobium sp. B2-6-6]|uniref:PIN domain-containing protein n=1 Tax=unclassified Mesorhizobium TaxID=325217 RepID=UPI001126A6D6|nr:type II toxin-antitoxin system VapC family toxin [Mesorhizobium sp. B2-6-6]
MPTYEGLSGCLQPQTSGACADNRLDQDVLPLFAGRILPFDLDASRAYADLMVKARASGKAIGNADAYIAATAAANGLTVATRDTGPFAAAGLNTINPWETAS